MHSYQEHHNMAQHHTASKPTLTHLAALHLARIRNNELPDGVKKQAVRCLLDYLGALVSGLSASWASSLLDCAQSQPSTGVRGAHVVGLKGAVSAEVAAFTNAAIAHR